MCQRLIPNLKFHIDLAKTPLLCTRNDADMEGLSATAVFFKSSEINLIYINLKYSEYFVFETLPPCSV